jgi:hypothetical protein
MAPTRSWIDPMFCSERSAALKADIAIGVACTVDSRFSAVTMISSNPVFCSVGVLPAGAVQAAALQVVAHNSAAIIDPRIPARASAAHNTCFMTESPFVGENNCAMPATDVYRQIFIP